MVMQAQWTLIRDFGLHPLLRSIVSGFGLARSLSKEPCTISQLVRLAYHALTLTTLERMINRTVKKVTDDMERFHYNTAIAALMEFMNFLQGLGNEGVTKQAVETLILLISPFAPHIAEEMWERTGHKQGVIAQSWPVYDKNKLTGKTAVIVVQVNGKLRDRIEVAVGAIDDDLKQKALDNDKVKAATEGKQPKKVIVVPGKLVNVVV
jgi:leucyl-tRNA synthetase